MIRLPLINKLLSGKWVQNGVNCGFMKISTATYPLQFQASAPLWAEPLKKKKRVDPAIIKAREDRKKKKIEKRIRQLQKLEKIFKPVIELQVPAVLVNNPENRKRIVEISSKEEEERILLMKEWSRINYKKWNCDRKLLNRLQLSQQIALQELRLESEELYQAAVQIDKNLIPFKYKGPVETPPKADYPLPDGEYIDVSKKWV